MTDPEEPDYPDVEHVGRMDTQTLWVCNECGLTLSEWSKRHRVGVVDDELVELDAPCPICRYNGWLAMSVIGIPEIPPPSPSEL